VHVLVSFCTDFNNIDDMELADEEGKMLQQALESLNRVGINFVGIDFDVSCCVRVSFSATKLTP